ncbi:hypothetical protein [Arthrobacter sp. AD-310]
MARNSKQAAAPSPARPAPATTALTSGPATWSRARRIYLAVGILACITGAMMIAFSL